MRNTHTIARAAIPLCAVLWSSACNAELICIHPIPLAIRELTEKRKLGLISEDLLHKNAEYLILKYCAATEERITPVSTLTIGYGCEMKSGYRLGDLVYWATCNTTGQKVETKKSNGKEKRVSREKRVYNEKRVSNGENDESMESLVACCLAYCRAIQCDSPPATTFCSAGYLSSTVSKYFHSASAYKKNFYTAARSVQGIVIHDCM